MDFKNLMKDKSLWLSLGGGALMLAGNLLKSTGDKQKSDKLLSELVEKAVEDKLQNK